MSSNNLSRLKLQSKRYGPQECLVKIMVNCRFKHVKSVWIGEAFNLGLCSTNSGLWKEVARLELTNVIQYQAVKSRQNFSSFRFIYIFTCCQFHILFQNIDVAFFSHFPIFSYNISFTLNHRTKCESRIFLFMRQSASNIVLLYPALKSYVRHMFRLLELDLYRKLGICRRFWYNEAVGRILRICLDWFFFYGIST